MIGFIFVVHNICFKMNETRIIKPKLPVAYVPHECLLQIPIYLGFSMRSLLSLMYSLFETDGKATLYKFKSIFNWIP